MGLRDSTAAPVLWVKERLRPPLCRTLALRMDVIHRATEQTDPMAELQKLCDEIGPRLSGSMAQQAASRQVVEYMRKIGLQQVRTEGWTLARGWQRGPAVAQLVRPFEISIPNRSIRCVACYKNRTNGQATSQFDPSICDYTSSKAIAIVPWLYVAVGMAVLSLMAGLGLAGCACCENQRLSQNRQAGQNRAAKSPIVQQHGRGRATLR